MKLICIILLATFTSAFALADDAPAIGTDGTVSLVCSPLHFCEVMLPPGSVILPGGIIIGDSIGWKTVPILTVRNRTAISITPASADLHTNMAVYSNVGNYRFRLESKEGLHAQRTRVSRRERGEVAAL